MFRIIVAGQLKHRKSKLKTALIMIIVVSNCYSDNSFCNVTSMAWNCGCSKKVPDFSPYLWPIVQAECSGRAQACQRQCNDQQQHQTGKPNCAVLCNDYYTCDSPNAPPSYLQTDTATETPSYNGPKKVVSTTPLANSTTNANQQQAHQGAGTAQAEIAWWLTIAMLIMVAF
ncbi:hypothetical protein CLU79DRAFT_770200 [Phycomyces nitens]|nr:hypothetical protein CLU79DRAFT_770200 [Phycomyces nitens]